MKEVSVADVIKNLGISFFYFAIGIFAGTLVGFTLFFSDKTLYQKIIQLFVKRITFGIQYFGNSELWFIANNLFVILMIVASSVFLMGIILRKRRPIYIKRFRRFEENRPQVTLFSLYMIPIGALIINGFLISLLMVYTFLNFDYQEFQIFFALLLPHGVTELLGLIFSTSIGLAYLEVLKPYILAKRFDTARKVGKKLLLSKTTLLVIIWIAILIIFSGYIEGSLVTIFSK